MLMGDEPAYNYAIFATPVFAGAIAIELWVARRRGRLGELYCFGTAVSDIGCGAIYQALEVLLTLVTFAVYGWIYEFRFVDWGPGSPWPWVVGALGVDFLYYWWHRVSHVSNLMWAVHGVHHQSEDYNLAVALRQPILEPITLMMFFWILALAGVPTLVFALCFGLNLFYQFWIHTELVQRLPRPIEWVLNTPSHHRVHHGIDAPYLDRNYGGVLVLWDRLFGTFEPEGHRPTYGTTVPLRRYDPLWGNAQHLHRTWQLSRAAPRWGDRLKAWVAHPAWLPDGVEDPATKPDRARPAKYRPPVSPSTLRYVLASMALVVLLSGPFVFIGHSLPLAQIVVGSGVLVLSYTVFGALVDGKRWAPRLDWLRIIALVVTTGWMGSEALGTTVGGGLALGLLLVSAGLRVVAPPTVEPALGAAHALR